MGYREREPGRLQLRVVVRPRSEGICEAIVDEDDENVYVRVIACYGERDDDEPDREYMNCPVHVYLETPLNGRAVIDVDSERTLRLFVRRW